MNTTAIQPGDLVEAGLYDSEAEVLQAALRHLLIDRPDLRTALAVHRYQRDRRITLARAAEIADVSLERMKEILVSHGVPLRLGPETLEEAERERAADEQWFNGDAI